LAKLRFCRRWLIVILVAVLAMPTLFYLWKEARSPTLRGDAHKIKDGMTLDEVVAVWGPPVQGTYHDEQDRWDDFTLAHWAARDGYLIVVLVDGRVVNRYIYDRSDQFWKWQVQRVRFNFGLEIQ
jgi:hypothetical protein